MKKKQTSSIIGSKPIVKYPNREALPMNKKSMIGISAVETAEQHRGNMPVIPKQITPFEKEIMEGAEVEANAAVTPIKKPGDYTHVKSFSEAFGAARKAGLSEFTWINPKTGKPMQYGTKLASEVQANPKKKASPVHPNPEMNNSIMNVPVSDNSNSLLVGPAGTPGFIKQGIDPNYPMLKYPNYNEPINPISPRGKTTSTGAYSDELRSPLYGRRVYSSRIKKGK